MPELHERVIGFIGSLRALGTVVQVGAEGGPAEEGKETVAFPPDPALPAKKSLYVNKA